MPRLQVRFGRTAEAKYVAHLDLMRAWERAMRRAHVPLAYSQGFSPHARLSTAAPLSVGMTSQAEAMDIRLAEPMEPQELMARLPAQLPQGLELYAAVAVPDSSPPLAAQLRAAEYAVEVEGSEVDRRVRELLACESIPWSDRRGGKTRRHNLRSLIEDLRLEGQRPSRAQLWMRLQAGPAGTGRPQEVAAVLGLEIIALHRLRLVFG